MKNQNNINEEINRCNFLINYDRSKTFLKNLYEQNTIPKLEIPSHKTIPSDATSVKDPRTNQIKSTSKTDIGWSEAINDLPEAHDVLPYLSFGSMLVPVIGPFLSLGFDLLDAYFYYAEGDTFKFGLFLALSIIPGDDVLKIISRRYKIGREELNQFLIKILENKSRLGSLDLKILHEIVEHGDEIVKIAARAIQEMLWKQLFKTLSLKDIIAYVFVWAIRNPAKSQILKISIKIGSISITYEQLAKIYGITPKNEIEKLPNKEIIEKNYEISKNDIDKQIIDSLIPFSENQIRDSVKVMINTMKSKYSNEKGINK